MADTHEGGCLCRAVRYQVVGTPNLVGVCHCTACQRRTGSAFAVAAYFAETAVHLTSGVLQPYAYHSDESQRWIRTEFCPTCGTTVTWTVEYFPGARGIAVGTFDDPNWLKPQVHIWTRSAHHWMVFPADVALVETARL